MFFSWKQMIMFSFFQNIFVFLFVLNQGVLFYDFQEIFRLQQWKFQIWEESCDVLFFVIEISVNLVKYGFYDDFFVFDIQIVIINDIDDVIYVQGFEIFSMVDFEKVMQNEFKGFLG